MATSKDIKWGSYREYEGPFYPGKTPFVLGDNPSFDQKVMAVLTATEGGRADAINMYDRCIISVGLIQWCEGGQYSVSGLLGAAADAHAPSVGEGSAFAKLLEETGYAFTKMPRGKWRFYKMRATPDEVDTLEEQRKLFLLTSNGKKGTWGSRNSPQRKHAKRWAAAVASVFEDPVAVKAQVDYTVPRLRQFLLPFAKSVFPRGDEHPVNPWNNVAYAAYVSFAGNNPTWANQNLMAFMKEHPLAPASQGFGYMWDEGTTIELLKKLAFGKRIGIYPHRYNAIRPVLEKLWNIDLPDFAKELERWEGWAWESKDVQQLLVDIGKDIGVSGPKGDGVDNIWGGKSNDALRSFQRKHGLKETGFPDKPTMEALQAVAKAAGAGERVVIVVEDIPPADDTIPSPTSDDELEVDSDEAPKSY